MARNSVTGRFRDIEIAFTVDGDATMMSVRNLVNEEKRVRVMYQKLAASGLANWVNFQLIHTPVLRRLPTEILEAHRLTFFVDDADPVSARIEKIVDELNALKPELPAENTPEDAAELNGLNPESITADPDETRTPALKSPVEPTAGPATPSLEMPNSHGDETLAPEDAATQQTGAAVEDILQAEISELVGTRMDENELPESDIEAAEQVEAPPPYTSEVDTPESTVPENEQKPEEKPAPTPIIMKLSNTQNAVPVSQIVDSNLEFKITVPVLPPSALVEQRKAQVAALGGTAAKSGTARSRQKEKGVFGQLAQALGLSARGRRGKTYYREKGEAIQNEFQDQLAKLERDYNEGYGLNLLNWDMNTLNEEEIAILLLNLMVNEVIAWQKETGRATPETEQLVQTLADVDTRLRQTLKQTRGASTPSPTLFPDLLAENERDLDKIQNECDAYLQRFASKLTEQEKDHALKIEVLIFKKFLTEFIRDYLFVEVAKSTQGNELPERLKWFLDLVNSEVIRIEVGKTKVSPKHHKVKGACASEFEAGTIVEIVTHGLQSKDGKRISQMAVVIEAE